MKTKYKILLCDDDKFISRMYAYKLEIEGYEVILVESGEKVVPEVEKHHPDLVVLDLILPVKSGFEILGELRQSSDVSIRNMPIVVASNLVQETDIATVRKLGATDFISKLNTSPKELVEMVERFLVGAQVAPVA